MELRPGSNPDLGFILEPPKPLTLGHPNSLDEALLHLCWAQVEPLRKGSRRPHEDQKENTQTMTGEPLLFLFGTNLP